MSYQAQFKGWNALTIEDLLIAYRKAKADCFFGSVFPTAIKFAEYEQDLLANLKLLLKSFKSDSGFEANDKLLGYHRLLPKKLSTEKKENGSENGHVHFSKPEPEPVNEFRNLTTKFGKHWAISGEKAESEKPIYIHNGVNFGVMACSELQNSRSRIYFQGAVDALIVLSWNKDLETFASLVESTALDVHAYTVLVNNRKYGDSRIRSPAKESFLRDIARLRGGDNDFVVTATLDITALRAFQSRAKRWPEDDDEFKPVPEGFKLSDNRKRLPPK